MIWRYLTIALLQWDELGMFKGLVLEGTTLLLRLTCLHLLHVTCLKLVKELLLHHTLASMRIRRL